MVQGKVWQFGDLEGAPNFDEDIASDTITRRQNPPSQVRSPKKKPGKARKGRRGRRSLPRISAEALDYAQDTLKASGFKLTARKRVVLLIVLKKLLNPQRFGAEIRNHDYPRNKDLMSEMKRAMRKAGLMHCPDLYRWWGRKAQVFFPSPELAGKHIFGTASIKVGGRGTRNRCRPKLSGNAVRVKLHPNPSSVLSDNVVEALKRGTGLRLDQGKVLAELKRLYSDLRDEANREAYSNILRSVGPDIGAGEITAGIWEQKSNGMMFARRRPIQCLPKEIVRNCLKSVDGTPVWRVDCRSFHMVLWLGKEAVEVIRRHKDFYEYLAAELSKGDFKVEPREIKPNAVAFLAGRTPQSVKRDPDLTGPQKHRYSEILRHLKKYLEARYPQQLKELRQARKTDKDHLNRKGAGIFYDCVAAGLENSGLMKIGIPLHDGVVFSARYSDYKRFLAGFCGKAKRHLGHGLPVNSGKIG